MKNNPLIVSLLTGLIVVLVIAGVSLLVKNKSLSELYKQAFSKSISLEREIEDIRSLNAGLSKQTQDLQKQIQQLTQDYEQKIAVLQEDKLRLEKLKERLEENLKDELMKQKLVE